MPADKHGAVPRQPEDPQPEDLLNEMRVCEPCTTSDLVDKFDASRWTIQRRLETLYEEGEVEKKKHDENRVSWWIPGDS